MAKYCKKCGAKTTEGVATCSVCGATVEPDAGIGTKDTHTPKSSAVVQSEKSDNGGAQYGESDDTKASPLPLPASPPPSPNGPNFFATDAGRWVVTILSAVLIWGIVGALWMQGSEISLVVILGCAVFGWQAINRHTPAFFLWMSTNAWIIYICVKGIVSALIGFVVAPFIIGRMIGHTVQKSVYSSDNGSGGNHAVGRSRNSKGLILGVGVVILGMILIVVIIPKISAITGAKENVSSNNSSPTTSIISTAPSNNTSVSGSHQYKFYISDTTWQNAYNQCKNMGGHLVTIDSESEFNQLILLMESQGYRDKKFYIGGSRTNGGKDYKWLNKNGDYYGSVLNSSEHWIPNDPSYADGDIPEMYMMIYYYNRGEYWAWADVPNDVAAAASDYKGKIGYICEIEN